MKIPRYVVIVVAAAVVLVGGAAAGYVAWKQYEASQLPAGIVATNGRVEATQVDISTKIAGRVIEIVPHEGDMVSPGEVVARIDTSETGAQLDQAKAAAALARQTVATREADVASDDAQLQFANEEMRRTATLVDKGWSTHEQYDQRKQQLKSAEAALNAAKSQVDEARASVKTADAKVAELQAVVDDSTIKSPVRGRVQYRLVEPGAVLPAGGKIATVIDLSDVYTTVFLPAPLAGRLKIGDEARVVVDAYPDYVFPATVSFVAPEVAIHSQDGRGPVRTGAAHVSREAAGASPVAQGDRRPGQGGLARRGLCQDRLCRPMAPEAGGQFAAHRSGRQIGRRDDDCAHRDGKAAEGRSRRRRLA